MVSGWSEMKTSLVTSAIVNVVKELNSRLHWHLILVRVVLVRQARTQIPHPDFAPRMRESLV